MNEGMVQTLIATPRVILEGMVIISLIILANILVLGSSQPAQFVPIIGAFALGAKSFASFQAIYASITSIKATKNNLKDVTNFDINTAEIKNNLPQLVFKHQILLITLVLNTKIRRKTFFKI